MGKRHEPLNIHHMLGLKVTHLFSYCHEFASSCPPRLLPKIAGADSFSIHFHSF